METKLSMSMPLCYDCQLIRHNDYSCSVYLGYCLDCCGCSAHLVPAARTEEHLGLFSLTKIKSQLSGNPNLAIATGLLLGLLLTDLIGALQ